MPSCARCCRKLTRCAARRRARQGARQTDAAEREPYLQKQKELKAEIAGLEEQERQVARRLDEQMALMPNIPTPTCPRARTTPRTSSGSARVAVREFDFEPRAHYEIGEAQGWLDFTRAAADGGSRNYMLFGDLALLHDAVLRLRGRAARAPRTSRPSTRRCWCATEAMFGTASSRAAKSRPTAASKDGPQPDRHERGAVTSLHGGEMLAEDSCRRRYVARSACFRREAGTLRQGHARSLPRAPVPQGRAGDRRRRRQGARSQHHHDDRRERRGTC
jgi:hypothetical protein